MMSSLYGLEYEGTIVAMVISIILFIGLKIIVCWRCCCCGNRSQHDQTAQNNRGQQGSQQTSSSVTATGRDLHFDATQETYRTFLNRTAALFDFQPSSIVGIPPASYSQETQEHPQTIKLVDHLKEDLPPSYEDLFPELIVHKVNENKN